eukprot:CAMPEP_0195277776 /NCGR_PEP_ID=MMETSP0706-20130129/19399_1 /TAXON_ID=33640 /ORGANISM="Asterionellopsis glacialis, Strain CCMP134" /LENGTH=256 /DNA_ID=CAMNT_0040335807 /DNA_START=33 /DNA_END=803 /DNA_ORIENTATION=+
MATTTKAFIRFMSTQGRKNVRDRSKKSSSVPFQSNANVATNNNRRTARERRAYPAGLGTSLNDPPLNNSCFTQIFYFLDPPLTSDRPAGSHVPRPSAVRRPIASNIKSDPEDLEEVPGPRRVLEARGVSNTFDKSATSAHRRTRKLEGAERAEPGGSVVASMSATAKFRQQRRVSKAAATNPSSLSLPITRPKSEHPYVREMPTVAKRKEKRSSDEADSIETKPKSRSGVIFTATATAVVGSMAYVYTLFGSNPSF